MAPAKGTTMEKKKGKSFNALKATQKMKNKRRQQGVKGRKAKPGFPKKKSLALKKRYPNDNKVNKKLMKKFGRPVAKAVKAKKVADVDPTKLINPEVLKAAVSGLRNLPVSEKKDMKTLHDITDEDERFVFLQVSLCKLPMPTGDFHLNGPKSVSVYLPHKLVTDSSDVILITRDLKRGIRTDHQNSLDHFKQHLHTHGATSLVSEVIPLRQLKVEFKEYEAKRHLANRADVLLCDDTVIRFLPKFLGKYFYNKNKLPIQVNLKATDLKKEILRALGVSKLFMSMKGNSSILKVGRMSQTDEEIRENVLAAVKKLSSHVPGQWVNIQALNLKLEKTKSIPLYVKLESLNTVKLPEQVKPLNSREPVSGTLSTRPTKCITVFPDGTVTATAMNDSKKAELIADEENETNNQTKESKSNKAKKKKGGSESSKVEPAAKELLDDQTGAGDDKEAKENTKKRKATKKDNKAKKQKTNDAKKNSKTKKQKKSDSDSDSDSDSGEDDLEEQEMTYLKQLNQDKKETAGSQDDGGNDSEDAWGDSDGDMEESD